MYYFRGYKLIKMPCNCIPRLRNTISRLSLLYPIFVIAISGEAKLKKVLTETS